jgi:hypothetical protein
MHPRKRWQQRRVRVDHATFEAGKEFRSDELHEAGADHQIRLVRCDVSSQSLIPGSSGGVVVQRLDEGWNVGAQGTLQMIGVDGDIRIGEIDLEPESSLSGVRQGFGQRVAGQQSVCLEGLIHPGEELLDDGLGVDEPVVELARRGEVVVADASLDLVQGADQIERVCGGLGLGALRIEQVPPRVRPALSVRDPGLGRVVGIGAVAVGEQHRPLGVAQP